MAQPAIAVPITLLKNDVQPAWHFLADHQRQQSFTFADILPFAARAWLLPLAGSRRIGAALLEVKCRGGVNGAVNQPGHILVEGGNPTWPTYSTLPELLGLRDSRSSRIYTINRWTSVERSVPASMNPLGAAPRSLEYLHFRVRLPANLTCCDMF